MYPNVISKAGESYVEIRIIVDFKYNASECILIINQSLMSPCVNHAEKDVQKEDDIIPPAHGRILNDEENSASEASC